MTAKVKDGLSMFWEAVKGVGIGMAVFIGSGILKYEKMTYDWQIQISNRVNIHDKRLDDHTVLIGNRQAYEGKKDEKDATRDKQITFLFAKFGIPLIQN